MSALVERLNEMQRERGMSGAAFARLLGVDRAVWSLVSRGQRPVPRSVMDSAFRLWPELASFYAQSLQISTDMRADQERTAV